MTQNFTTAHRDLRADDLSVVEVEGDGDRMWIAVQAEQEGRCHSIIGIAGSLEKLADVASNVVVAREITNGVDLRTTYLRRDLAWRGSPVELYAISAPVDGPICVFMAQLSEMVVAQTIAMTP
jgi:hypothetical protein